MAKRIPMPNGTPTALAILAEVQKEVPEAVMSTVFHNHIMLGDPEKAEVYVHIVGNGVWLADNANPYRRMAYCNTAEEAVKKTMAFFKGARV